MSEKEDAHKLGSYAIIIVMVAFPCAMYYTFGKAGLAWAFVGGGIMLWNMARRVYRQWKIKEGKR